ncbi:MAG: phenylacetate--CoA ligase [Deltaproteobacteria bacterium]|nr:phenylacetate--CoA ligase [Deltaproteobacteria bacterium]
MAILDTRMECCPRGELEQLQLERLQPVLNRMYKNVAFYRSLFDERSIVPEDVCSMQDFRKLPFTTRSDLTANYPYGMFAVPLREVVRIHTATDTTDTPTVVGYSAHDLQTWAALVARFLSAGGVTRDDVIQVSFRYGLFSGAFGLHHGAEQIGASVIPASSEHTDRQIRIMQDYRTSVLVATPSFALLLADRMEALGIDPKLLMLKRGLFGGEIWSEDTRRQIEQRLFIQAFDNYGVSELMGPGIAGECSERSGMHICEDHILPEIIDPATGRTLAPGETGELVLTTLTREAFPLLRYRTGDLTSLNYAPCACGRTLVRMSRIERRTDDIVIVKGINIVPQQIEKILTDIEGIEPLYRVIVGRENNRDSVTLHVAVSEHVFFDEVKHHAAFVERLRSELSRRLGLRIEVKLMEKRTLDRELETGPRVLDTRNL